MDQIAIPVYIDDFAAQGAQIRDLESLRHKPIHSATSSPPRQIKPQTAFKKFKKGYDIFIGPRQDDMNMITHQ